MSEIITAESVQEQLKAEEGNEQQDNMDSPDEVKDENLETDKVSDSDLSEDVDESGDDESEELEESEELSEDIATESTDESDKEEDDGDLDKTDKPDIPKWAEKRLLRERRKHEREIGQLKQQVSELVGNIQQQSIPQYDQNTQIQNPFTGQIVDINSVEGQVAIQLTQAAQLQAQTEQQEKTQKAKDELKRKLEKGYDKFDDYEEVILDAGITETMLEAAYLSDKTDELIYNLAKYKPDEIDRISKLSPERQFREMVLLESKMKQSTKKKIVKKVPEPPSKIKGSGASVKDESDLSFEDILKRRRQKERERLK